ncbi:LytR/AlgR family response regulator transcription factor [Flavihumibacter profundi]|uniref:LytR/AlgR family response regulator transcription factor n=1 Tax=Flavihumibacter profundi TaxID=2716883 RepID=UPI001CC522C1|nr:response regulator [Flavihumibacter profundi]MBZ5858413.1 LytTR family transcriptional regulator DNA-binding domain-containing protein [Flavihumibacter profundi]
MDKGIKILVVEDEMIIGAKISMLLTDLGYEVTGILPRGEEAIQHVSANRPDIVLLDINLKGKLDGIETALQIQKIADIPIIYLTANADEATFNRAKISRPAAFISKPFKQLDLQRAIELTISRMAERATGPFTEKVAGEEQPFILSDRIFIRHSNKMVKIMLAEILYMEADRNYCRIFTQQKEYLLAITLKTIEEKLPMRLFLRIHRSYIINLSHVDEVAESHVMLGQKTIPLSADQKEKLLKSIKTL